MRIRARRYADLLERDGEALVLLTGGGLLRLSAIGAAIVELATNPIQLDTLAGALEHRFGAPPEGSTADLTAAMVRELSGQGLLDLGEPPRPPGDGPWWRISDDAAFVVSGPDRVVVLNLASPGDQPKALLGSAAAIWQAMIGQEEDLRPWIGQTELIADLVDAYALEPSGIEPDVHTFLTEMQAGGYLEFTAGKAAQDGSLGPATDGG